VTSEALVADNVGNIGCMLQKTEMSLA